MLEWSKLNANLVTELDGLCRLRALAVEGDLPATDRLGRQRARLEETRRPEPFV